MDIKERIKEVAQNGTLQSGEEIYYVETDDLYAILAEIIASESNDIHPVITREFKTTEIVFKYPCGDTVVKYRADYGTKEAQELMDQIKHKSKYFYRHV